MAASTVVTGGGTDHAFLCHSPPHSQSPPFPSPSCPALIGNPHAYDGLEALEIVRASPTAFKLVLLDLTMPRMDGEETLCKLREINPNLRVILTSGFNEQSTINRFVGRGIAGFLPKLFTVGMITEQLRKIYR